MQRDCGITAALKRRQITMFAEAEKAGLSQKVLHYDTGGPGHGISLSSLGEYARGETAISGPALLKLIGIIPDHLLSLLLPEGRRIVRVPELLDHDEVASWAEEYTARKLAAHRTDSECQEQIGPNEKAELDCIVVAFPGKAAA